MRTYGHKTTRRTNGTRQNDGKGGTSAGKKEEYRQRRRFPPHYETTDERAGVAKTRGQGGTQETIRESDKETRNRREDWTPGILVRKENNGWNREAQNGKGQGLKAKNADANALGGGRTGDELRNPGGEGEQW